jgi:peroxiredoxin family protein
VRASTEVAESAVESRMSKLEAEVSRLRRTVDANRQEERVSVVCFSGDWDRLFAAFIIANGALALGQDVHMFFTFWGATAVRRAEGADNASKSWIQRMLGYMLPSGIAGAPLSKMNFGGLGKVMMGKLMREKGVDDLPSMVRQARELGARFHCCDTSLALFGWGSDELVDGENADWCGVSTFLSLALKSKIVLFI